MARAPWYDPDRPDELHGDLRVNYASALNVINRRPATVRHFEGCAECRAIRDAHEAAPPPLTTRKELLLRISATQMRELLKLPPGHDIVVMYAEMNPNAVYVRVAGADLPAVAADAPVPLAGAGAELPQAA